MKQNIFRTLMLAALASAMLSACKPKSTAPVGSGASEPVVLGPQYTKKGLLLPEDTRLSLGVRVAEVTEQRVSATLELSLRVYQVGDNGGRASGTVAPEQAKSLKSGQAVEMKATDGHTFSGKVTHLNDDLEKATGSIEVLVEFPPSPDAVFTGAFLQAHVTLDAAENVVSVPRAALLQCSDGYSVYTVSGGHLVRAPVKVGATSGDFVEIKDGLYSGDQVVLQPVMSLWMTELQSIRGGKACADGQ